MIKELTNLSPAEVLLLENPDVTIDALARVTFLDLILKQVLEIIPLTNASEAQQKNPLVKVGKAYANYQPLKHEAIFMAVFSKDDTLQITLSNLLKSAFEKVKNSEQYKLKYIYSDERLKPYYSSNFFQRLLGIRVITKEGLKAQKEIKRELRRIKINASRKTKNAVELLLAIKGNIVLIPKIPTEIFQQLEKKNASIRKNNFNTLAVDIGYASLFYHNTAKNQFDIVALDDADFSPSIESISGFGDTSVDGSFGADSGCGGCAGCGGCGGCGG